MKRWRDGQEKKGTREEMGGSGEGRGSGGEEWVRRVRGKGR